MSTLIIYTSNLLYSANRMLIGLTVMRRFCINRPRHACKPSCSRGNARRCRRPRSCRQGCTRRRCPGDTGRGFGEIGSLLNAGLL